MLKYARYLDNLESLTEDANILCPYGIEYEGEIEIESLIQAYRHLCTKHPILRSRVVLENKRFMFVTPDEYQPKTVVFNGGQATLKQVVSDGIMLQKNAHDTDCDVSDLFIITGDRGGYVLLRLRHSVCDPYNLGVYFSELFDLYTAIVEGEAIQITPGKLPRSPIGILTQNWGDSSKISTQPFTPKVGIEQTDTNANSAKGFSSHIKLDAGETQIFINLTKKKRAKVSATILGATLLSLKQDVIPNAHQKSTFNVGVFATLRHRLEPPVSATETTYLTGRCVVPIDTSASEDEFEIGFQFTERLAQKIAKREIVIPGYSSSHLGFDTEIDVHLNGGMFSRPRHPKNMSIVSECNILDLLEKDMPASKPVLNLNVLTMNNSLTVTLKGGAKHKAVDGDVQSRLKFLIESSRI